MNMGFAWHGPRWADELDPQPRPSSDRAYFRSHGVDVDAAWPKLLDVYPTFARYLARSPCTIPVVRLEPRERSGGPAVEP